MMRQLSISAAFVLLVNGVFSLHPHPLSRMGLARRQDPPTTNSSSATAQPSTGAINSACTTECMGFVAATKHCNGTSPVSTCWCTNENIQAYQMCLQCQANAMGVTTYEQYLEAEIQACNSGGFTVAAASLTSGTSSPTAGSNSSGSATSMSVTSAPSSTAPSGSSGGAAPTTTGGAGRTLSTEFSALAVAGFAAIGAFIF